MRRTKIIATLGPATDDPKVMDRIIEAGVDVVRINFSHGSHEEHIERAERVRNRARAHGRQVGVLCDLQGPKIRIQQFKDGKVNLVEGDAFILDTEMDPKAARTGRQVGNSRFLFPDKIFLVICQEDSGMGKWGPERNKIRDPPCIPVGLQLLEISALRALNITIRL